MKIALLQINPTVGDLDGNARLIADAAREAGARGADLAVTPELALVGYLPRDLLLSPATSSRAAGMRSQALARDAGRSAADAGRPARAQSVRRRAAALQQRRAAPRRATSSSASARRCCPPTTSSTKTATSSRSTARRCSTSAAAALGISICEDIWNDRDFWKRRRYHHDPVEELVRAGAQAIVNLSASPFTVGKHARREEMLGSMARQVRRAASSYVNQVGGNDDLVFDGRSCAFDVARRRRSRARRVVRRRRRRLRSRRARRRSAPATDLDAGIGDLARARARHARLRAQVRLHAASCSACRAASTPR